MLKKQRKLRDERSPPSPESKDSLEPLAWHWSHWSGRLVNRGEGWLSSPRPKPFDRFWHLDQFGEPGFFSSPRLTDVWIQGYLAHKKTPNQPSGTPQGP
jgi:hypothetical protein